MKRSQPEILGIKQQSRHPFQKQMNTFNHEFKFYSIPGICLDQSLKSMTLSEIQLSIEPYQLYERTLITKDNVLERIPLIAAIPFYAVDATFDMATTALATAIRVPLSILSVYK